MGKSNQTTNTTMSINKLTTALLAMAASANAIRISQDATNPNDDAIAREDLARTLADLVLYTANDQDPTRAPRFANLDQPDDLLREEIYYSLITDLTFDEMALKARVIRQVCPDYVDETSACDGFDSRGPDGTIADMLFDYLRGSDYHADASDHIEEKLSAGIACFLDGTCVPVPPVFDNTAVWDWIEDNYVAEMQKNT